MLVETRTSITASRRRILYWSGTYRPYIGGVQVLLSMQLPALVQRGFEISVVTSHHTLDLPDRETIEGVDVYRLRLQEALAMRTPGADFHMRQEVGKLKQQLQPQLVHVNLYDASLYFHLRTMTTSSAPTVLEIPYSILDEPVGPETWRGKALKAATWITSPSAATLSDVWQVAPDTQARSSVILNALPLPALMPGMLQIDNPRIVCLGRVVPEKGFDVAVRAFATIALRYPRARLIIAGDGPGLPPLMVLAADLDIAQRVDFPGAIPPTQVYELINTSMMVVIPSRWREAFCLVALQAAQMARPVVATRTGGLPEVVVDGETGLLVPVDDVSAMAAAIARLLDDPGLAIAMGRQARHRAEAVFAWDRYVGAYESLYRRLIAETA